MSGPDSCLSDRAVRDRVMPVSLLRCRRPSTRGIDMDMDVEKFEALVARAIERLPQEFMQKLENVDIVIQDWPTHTQLRRARLASGTQLLGLYEGVPQTRRGRSYGLVLPDKISIFRKPIEARCRSEGDVEVLVGRVVRHELAHHFGIDEGTLRSIERRGRSR